MHDFPSAINGKGWFVATISGLVCGDTKPMLNQFNNFKAAHEIESLCRTITFAGFSRLSRKGWHTIEHPILGILQWKAGTDFRTAGGYFFLRVNGREILSAWPKAGQRETPLKWNAPQGKAEWEVNEVERILGSI